MINYKATTENRFSEIFLDNHYSHSPRHVKQAGRRGFRLYTSDVKFTNGRKSERSAGSLQSGVPQKGQSSMIRTRRAINGMKPERACLSPQTHSRGGCVRNAEKGQSRDRLFYQFQRGCRSVCHFFKEVSQDHSNR